MWKQKGGGRKGSEWEERTWKWGMGESPYGKMMASEERLWKVFRFSSLSESENNVEELGNT